MHTIYRVTIRGRTLESRDLRKLLAKAVEEKRNMDRVLRYAVEPDRGTPSREEIPSPPEKPDWEVSGRVM